MFRLKLQIWFPICMLLLGCRQTGMEKTGNIAVIEVVQNLGKYQAVHLSELVSELEYIPLETGDDCLFTSVRSGFIVTSTHIFVADGNQFCYAFGRDGRFIGEIGRRGQGPGEYSFTCCLSIDKNNQSVFIDALYYLLEYSWDGVFRRSFKIPIISTYEDNNRLESSHLSNVFFVRDNLFIGHVDNHTGSEKYNFHLINDSGKLVKSFDNHMLFDRKRPQYSLNDWSIVPFRISESIYLKEYGNDTLYCLNEQNELIPHFVFDLGKYAISKNIEKRTEEFNSDNVYHRWDGIITIPSQLLPMIGTPNYIFFSNYVTDASTINISFPEKRPAPAPILPANTQNIRYVDTRTLLGLYDIVNQKTRLLDTDPVTRKPGLINDLDGGLTFWPQYYTSDNELVDIWQAYEMKELLTEEYFAAHEIKDIQAHQKLKELLKNLDEYDNPVVVIAKLKK